MKTRKLPLGIYDIPTECRAVIRSGQVAILPRSTQPDTPRCITCIHCIPGRSSYHQRSLHLVCELRPKTARRNPPSPTARHYAVQLYDTACDRYQPKPSQQLAK